MKEKPKIRVLIVDDEPPGRMMLRRMLANHTQQAEIIGECENGVEAIAAIKTQAPDIVFLDVQMPETDGFTVIESVKENLPVIVFVTAYDEYAVRAFEVKALDYLLKPYDRKRFDQAFERAVGHLQNTVHNSINERIISLLSAHQLSKQFIERIIIKNNGRVFFLNIGEVIWIEAEGNYVLLHTAGKNHIFREAISNLEQKLDPQKFCRINRSTIINLDHVKELQTWTHGDLLVLLKDNTKLKLSHRYRENLSRHFGGSL